MSDHPSYTSFVTRRSQLAISAALGALILVTWLAYQPALPGFFLFDDFDNLGALQVAQVQDLGSIDDYLSAANAGPSGRPISKLSFLIDDNAWPSAPGGFKRTNLLIHLLIGVLLFATGRRILARFYPPGATDWLALTAAAVWLLHPLQVSTVMYVVQRMTQLSALFVTLGVLTHLWLRLRSQRQSAATLVLLTLSVASFTLLATYSKENGVLLPVYLLVLEYTVLVGLPTDRLLLWWRRAFLILPSVALIAYLAYWPHWQSSYSTRDFSLGERLLTEPVVLVDYLSHLVSFRVVGLGLFQDDYPIYSSLFSPAVSASLLLLGVALAVALVAHRRWPLLSLGILWFLAGHLLESTTVPLEIYFEHRNYLAVFGPILAAAALIYSGLGRLSGDLRKVAPAIAVGFIAMSALTTWGYAADWGLRERLLPIWAAEHPNSPRAQRTYAVTLAEFGEHAAALDALDTAYRRFPKDLSIPLLSIDISCRFAQPVRYDLTELARRVEDHVWTDALRPAIKTLSDGILNNHCRPKTAELHAFIRRLLDLPSGELRRSGLAAFMVLSGELYLREHDADGALRAFHTVDILVPSADSALRIASVYLLVQDYPRGLAAIELAQSRALAGNPWRRAGIQAEFAGAIERIESLQATKQGAAGPDAPSPPGTRP
ncbi:hypothetical protein [uncultured Lamprocystis sp.]|uniref:hypothetical protein n=1 Tax=uncultured Lamprocystis sp. TaxID=543132 RepID=UPI0025DAD9A6|nr:hypothetical protein [uncultured Lamprocystis sp.]